MQAFNDDCLQVGIHQYMNMEIISVLVKRKMNHKDSMGYETIIEEDGVQIMSAGSGLKHEEYNIGNEEVNFLQIWIHPKLQNIIQGSSSQFSKIGQEKQDDNHGIE